MLSVFEAKNCIDFLNAELERRLSQNPSYSLRAYARDLKLSPGALSDLLNKKRSLTKKAAAKIADALEMNSLEKLEFTQLSLKIEATVAQEKISESVKLDLEYFKAIESWYHFSILNLLDTKKFRANIRNICSRLGISYVEAKLAIDRLEKLGLIQLKGDLVFATKDSLIETPTDIPASSIKNYHHQMLDKAKIALDEQSTKERSITGLGFAFDPKLIKPLKNDIDEFQNYILDKYSTGSKTEVYQIEIAVFKISK